MRGARRRWERCVSLLIFALLLCLPERTWAQDVTRDVQKVFLDVDGGCPSADAIAQELSPLVDRWQVVPVVEEADEIVRATDNGDTFDILVVGDRREIADKGRDCKERARVAAVIIALRLEPALGAPEPEPEPERQTEAAPAPPVAPGEQHPMDLELGVGFLAERSLDAPMRPGVGGLVTLAFSIDRWTLIASGGLQSRTMLDAEGVELSFSRFPIDLGLGPTYAHDKWRFQPLALLALDNFRVAARGVEASRTSGRLEMGPRLAFRVSRDWGRLRPFGLLRAAWMPRSYIVDVEPLGEIARTPHWWVGASIGLGTTLFRR